jgi:hypothetical protein
MMGHMQIHPVLGTYIWGSKELSSQKSLQSNDGTYANSPSTQLGMGFIMPTKAQTFLLVTAKGDRLSTRNILS